MDSLLEARDGSPVPRKAQAFQAALGPPPVALSRAMLDQVRILAATSNEGVVLLLGTSALWLVPWVMDAMQAGTRAVVVVPPGDEPRLMTLGALLQDDLRLAVRAQAPTSFVADMVQGEQHFDLIVDLERCVPPGDTLDRLFRFGSLVVGGGEALAVDPSEALGVAFYADDDARRLVGQLIKPRPTPLRRRGGRKGRLAGRKPGDKPPKELFEGAF